MKLAGKTVIVTGGTRGIGEALVRKLAAEGANVAFSFLTSTDRAAAIEAGLRDAGAPGRVFGMRADVRSRKEVDALIARAIAEFGRIDAAVNNAHQAYEGRAFADAAWDDFQREIDTLVRGPFNVVQACLPQMKAQGRGGAIVNIGSTMALAPRHRHSFYITAKCALMGMTQSLALELGRDGIRVNMVTPGPLATDHNASYPVEVMKRLNEETPLHGRIATVEEVADAIALLLLDEARAVTGANMLASAGFAIA
jgi:3-oxoacyl-[acyl-carrier protein] reductase